MGKADADRDYYGDLELEATADPNDIKRQFHKLGMILLVDRRDAFTLTVTAFQLSSTIPIEIRAKRWNTMPNFKPYNPPMRCSQTHNNGQNTMHSACVQVYYIPMPVALLRLQNRVYLQGLQ